MHLSEMPEEQLFSTWVSWIRQREQGMASRIEDADLFLSHYRMSLSKHDLAQQDLIININYHFGIARNILPQIYYQNPDVLCTPRFPRPGMPPMMAYEYARIREELLKYQIRHIDLETEVRKAIFDAMFWGFGVVKVGYMPVLQDGAQPTDFEEATGRLIQDAWSGGSAFADPSEMDYDFDPNENVRPTDPFAVRLSPRYFLIDPLATTIKDARWVIHRVLKPVEELKRAKKYSRGLTSGIQGTRRWEDQSFLNEVSPSSSGSGDAYSDGDYPLTMIYEVWDKENKQLLVLDEWNMEQGSKKFLQKDDWPYKSLDSFPFAMLVFNPDPESPFGVSDAKVWHPPTMASNKVHNMRYNHIKRFNRKYETPKNNLDPTEMAKLQAPNDGAIIETNNRNGGPSIIPIMDAPMSGDVYSFLDSMRMENEMLTGLTEQRKGQDAKSKTATEASLLESGSRARDGDRISLVTKFVETIVRKMDRINQEFLGAEYVSFITRPEAAMLWEKKAPEILKMDMELDLRVGSSAYVDRNVRQKQLMDFLSIAVQAVDPHTGMPIVNVRPLFREIGHLMLNDVDMQEFIVPMMPPPTQGPVPPVGGGSQPGAPSRAPGMGSPSMGDQFSRIQGGPRGASGPPNPRNERR